MTSNKYTYSDWLLQKHGYSWDKYKRFSNEKKMRLAREYDVYKKIKERKDNEQ